MGRSELRTARMVLRTTGVEHLPLLIALDADPEGMRFILGRARTLAEAERFLEAACLEPPGLCAGPAGGSGTRRSSSSDGR